MSGPVAGAVAVAELARRLGARRAPDRRRRRRHVASTRASITDGRLPVLYEGEIVGLPLQTPWVDVRSIGAGGGSIASRRRRRPAARRPAERRAPTPGPGVLRPRRHRADGHRRRRRASACSPTATLAGDVAARRAAGRGGARRRSPGRSGSTTPRTSRAASLRIAARAHGRRDPRHHRRAGRATRATRRSSRSAAPAPLFGTLLARRARHRPARRARRTPATSPPGACSAPTSRRPPRAPGSRALDDGALAGAALAGRELLRRARRARRGPTASAARDPPRHALRRPGAHADRRRAERRRHARDGRRARAARPLLATEYSRTFGHTMDEAVEIVAFRVTPRRRCRAAPRRRRRRRRDGARGARRAQRLVVRARRALHVRRSSTARALAPGDALRGPADRARADATTYLDAGFVGRRVAPTTRRAASAAGRGGARHERPDRVHRAAFPAQPAPDVDPVTTEIVRQGLNAAADQMKRALVRTSFSPVIYEVLDFAAALYDRDVAPARAGAEPARRSWAR